MLERKKEAKFKLGDSVQHGSKAFERFHPPALRHSKMSWSSGCWRLGELGLTEREREKQKERDREDQREK